VAGGGKDEKGFIVIAYRGFLLVWRGRIFLRSLDKRENQIQKGKKSKNV